MKYIKVYLKEVLPSDLTLCNTAASFLQSGFWGSFKARFGWNARSFLADWGGLGQRPLLVIRRRLGPGISFAYVPWGPELPDNFPESAEERTAAMKELAECLRSLIPRDTAFIRFDPPWYTDGVNKAAPLIKAPFIRAGVDVQPPDTVLVDLSPPEERILSAMKPKWRYNVRLAGKKGVVIKRGDEDGLDSFYHLLKETAKRDSIAIHGIEYYRTLFSHCREYPGQEQQIALYTALHEGETIAAAVVLFRRRQAVYLYGASSDTKRNLMAPYALQWKAMTDAKALGCLEYDLFGIPPNPDPAHSMAGLYLFKTGFGGRIVHRPGSWDYLYRPFMAGLFNKAELLRKKLRNLKRSRKLRQDSEKSRMKGAETEGNGN
ncbi:MAG: peptidoglycan bridge formation glycyltransferase FemA/FemB family protein [Treponema sp.]|nr:peptidoglycan bridge formation glycyltransferase FemA/FemB family protein [Treponema sp.]